MPSKKRRIEFTIYLKMKNKKTQKSIEFSSEFVKISRLIKSNTNKKQAIKINDKYYIVRELG